MSVTSVLRDTRDGPRARRSLAAAVVLAMFSMPLLALMPCVSSDPVETANPDDTASIVWDFDDESDYVLTDAMISGGRGTLARDNASDSDDNSSSFALGTGTNIDMSSLPGSLVIDSTERGSYTVTIQPTAATSADTFISEDKPNDNFGLNETLALDSESARQLRILLRFDLSSIPSDASIENATVLLYELSGSRPQTVAYTVHALEEPYNHLEATWNKRTLSDQWATAGGDFSAYVYGSGSFDDAAGWRTTDVSKLVELWVSGTLENNGIIFVPKVGGGDALKLFQSADETALPSRSPKLVVNYTLEGDSGEFESRVLGPGFEVAFTLAEWQNGTHSFATDEFSGTSLSPIWTWLNDPVEESGSYDVGITTPGWLHVLGARNTQNFDTTIGANYLYQHLSGDFEVTSRVKEAFAATSMGAGILIMESTTEWVSIEKSDPGTDGTITVTECAEGIGLEVAILPWPNNTLAYLRTVRQGGQIGLYVSPDNASWTLVYDYSNPSGLKSVLSVGPFIYSQTTTAPVAEWDYFRATTLDASVAGVMVRTGNSTDTSDPSWEPWGAWLPSQEVMVSELSQYVQYMVYLETTQRWCSPRFDSFTCWFETFVSAGTIETMDYTPTDFSKWLTMTTVEDPAGGTVAYYYSTNSGGSWTYVGTGGTYTILSYEHTLRIRVALSTSDMAVAPSVDSVTVTFVVDVKSFYVSAPGTVTAGAAFATAVYAKEDSNDTMANWTGSVSLSAMDASGAAEATGDLSVSAAQISSNGYVIVLNQRYYVAETITINASNNGAHGLSEPITVVPGPAASLVILPTYVTEVDEHTSQVFTANTYDTYGNAILGLDYEWTLEGGIGALSSTTGQQITFFAGDGDSVGWLNVTSVGLSASRQLTILVYHDPVVFNQDLPNQTVEEDFGSWYLDLAPFVTDNVHTEDELRWYATNEQIVTVAGENRTGHMTMMLTTSKDAYGTDVLRVTVVDPEGLAATANLTVTIVPVNDAPTIDYIDPLVVHYDEPYFYNLRYHVADVDDSYDNLTILLDPISEEYVSVERLTLQLHYPETLNGTTQQITVTVTDGKLLTTTMITVHVSDDHVPVLIEPLPDVTMYQGDTLLDVFDLSQYFADPDEDELAYGSEYEHVGVSVTDEGSVNMFAPTDWWGEEYVVFSAIDPSGGRVEDAVLVTVLPVNQPPWIGGIPDLIVRYDASYQFDLSRYMGDPNDDIGDLEVTSSDPHVTAMERTLTILYPSWMVGSEYQVELTVSDGELFDSCILNVTVSYDYPPEAGLMPDHSFMEDVPIPYPVDGGLDDLFTDVNPGDHLTFAAFSWTEEAPAVASTDALGTWKVWFNPQRDWFGTTQLTIRATDTFGALAESTVSLTVASVADAPELSFDSVYNATAGVRAAFDISSCISDPDSALTELSFEVEDAYADYVTALAGVLVLDFPSGFVGAGESRTITVEVTVTDRDGLDDTDVVSITVSRAYASPLDTSPWIYVTIFILAGAALAMFMVVVTMRKMPFIIKDAMLIHNDGFLIDRFASPAKGEIDQDVLSGMLTSVLNFVEDSMAGNSGTLKSFGFREYKVLVKRSKLSFLALVHEGDAPEQIERAMAEFLEKVEKVYRKNLGKWSGDIDNEFAGVELLLQAFVKDNSRRGKSTGGIFWKAKEKAPPQAKAE